jgi:hypothetical protein
MKQSPQWIYEQVYCQRGDIENRIKELHDLEIDRTSCTSFRANQFRVLLTAAACVLMQELRLRAAAVSRRSLMEWYDAPSASSRISLARNTYPAGKDRDWAIG